MHQHLQIWIRGRLWLVAALAPSDAGEPEDGTWTRFPLDDELPPLRQPEPEDHHVGWTPGETGVAWYVRFAGDGRRWVRGETDPEIFSNGECHATVRHTAPTACGVLRLERRRGTLSEFSGALLVVRGGSRLLLAPRSGAYHVRLGSAPEDGWAVALDFFPDGPRIRTLAGDRVLRDERVRPPHRYWVNRDDDFVYITTTLDRP